MSRLALCLFFIAIFHNGILKVAHAEETTTEGLSKTNAEEEVTTKTTVVEKDKVVDEGPVKAVPETKSEEPSKTEPKVEEVADTVIQTTAATPIEKKDAKVIEPKKEGNAEDNLDMAPIHVLRSVPIKHTEVFFEFPSKVLGGANVVGEHIGAAIARTIDSAKYLAAAPFGFLRSAVNSAFE